jgi:hypothetical protein
MSGRGDERQPHHSYTQLPGPRPEAGLDNVSAPTAHPPCPRLNRRPARASHLSRLSNLLRPASSSCRPPRQQNEDNRKPFDERSRSSIPFLMSSFPVRRVPAPIPSRRRNPSSFDDLTKRSADRPRTPVGTSAPVCCALKLGPSWSTLAPAVTRDESAVPSTRAAHHARCCLILTCRSC